MSEVPTDLPDFSGGKVVWFETAGQSEKAAGVLLEHIEFKGYGGRLFAAGRMAQAKAVDGWLSGAPAAVAWDSVVNFIVFASRDEYGKRAAAYQRPNRLGLFR